MKYLRWQAIHATIRSDRIGPRQGFFVSCLFRKTGFRRSDIKIKARRSAPLTPEAE
jgi:hypothetical protein